MRAFACWGDNGRNWQVLLGMETYSKPMCEWISRRAHRMESVTGFREPAAKGAIVKGMSPAEMILGCVLVDCSILHTSPRISFGRIENEEVTATWYIIY